MGIRFDFDRGDLTEREAQLLRAMIDLHWLGLTLAGAFAVRGAPMPRDIAETMATGVRAVLARALPDVAVRWRWEEDPPPSEPPPAGPS